MATRAPWAVTPRTRTRAPPSSRTLVPSEKAMGSARAMGEFPMTASSPNGWPLVSDAWTGPDAVLNRIEWAKQVGARMPPNFDAAAAADTGMGPLLSAATKTAMARAETQGDALALLISSPEFQRR